MTQQGIPPVTVVITAFNYAAFIAQAVESALLQTLPSVEVLVVDDGSTDATPDILRSFGDRIRIDRQPNAGLSAARNRGIDRASHPWIAFLDADDAFEPNALERMAATLSLCGPSYGVVACQDLAMDAAGVPIPRLQPAPGQPRDITAADLVVMNRFPPSVLARRSVLLEAGGFDTSLTSSEDRDLWIRCARVAKIRLIKEPLLRKRRHGSNMSSNAERQSRNIRVVLQKARKAGVVSPSDLGFWARVWGVYHFQSALMQEGAGRQWKALSHLAVSAALQPVLRERRDLRQPPLCRLRAAARCLRTTLRPVARRDP